MKPIIFHGNGLRRAFYRKPGYDCRMHCPHGVVYHGWQPDEWFYVVANDEAALTFQVSTSYFDDDVKRDREARLAGQRQFFGRNAQGKTFHFYSALAKTRDHEHGANSCQRCYYVEVPGARSFWAKHGDDKQCEQDEAFWKRLEAEFRECWEALQYAWLGRAS